MSGGSRRAPPAASAQSGEIVKGGTGFGVRTLLELARTFDPPAKSTTTA